MNLKLCKTLYLVSCLFQDWEIYQKDIIRVLRTYYKCKLALLFIFFTQLILYKKKYFT